MTDLHALLLSPHSPPFIYLHHPHHLPTHAIPPLPSTCVVARVDAIEHHTPRLLYSGIVGRAAKALGQARPEGEVASWDLFARALSQVWDARGSGRGPAREAGSSSRLQRPAQNGSVYGQSPVPIVNDRGKGKGKEKEVNVHVEPLRQPRENGTRVSNGHSSDVQPEHEDERSLVVVITKAERLRTVLGPGWAVITRLAELTGVPATVVLASTVPWDELRPPRGDALEPVHIYVPPLSREETLQLLLPASSHPLWPRFLDLLLATVSPLLPAGPPTEIAYLAEALWPIYTSLLPPHAEQFELQRGLSTPSLGIQAQAPLNGEASSSDGISHDPVPPDILPADLLPPPPLPITLKLLTDLKAQLALPLAAATESLLPRVVGWSEFIDAMTPRPGVASSSHKTVPRAPNREMPLVGKYLLVAGYCASYNPAKTDLRLFGRAFGPGGKRKRGGGTRRAGYGKTRAGKVPQRLLGPKPFPLDRLLALFASLYAENAERPPELEPAMNGLEDEDDDNEADEATRRFGGGLFATLEEQKARVERKRKREEEREGRWEDEVWHLTMSVKLWGMIPELEGHGLLKRVSPPDRLDNVMLRCELDYEGAKILARELRITLDEYLYEQAM